MFITWQLSISGHSSLVMKKTFVNSHLAYESRRICCRIVDSLLVLLNGHSIW